MGSPLNQEPEGLPVGKDYKVPDYKRNFILQQGFDEPSPQSCPFAFSGLMFQPRIVGAFVLLGVITGSAGIFLVLSGVLWWSAFVPRRNPFDALYNRMFGSRPGAPNPGPAPPPRRFSQGMAASFTLATGLLLHFQLRTAAFVVEVLLLVAVAAINFGSFCLGSFIYYLIRGETEFAMRTLPWRRGAH